MRWFVGGAVALLLVWTLYVVSPYWALLDLSRAVSTRDSTAIAERINLRALRVELTKQIIAAAAASRTGASALGSQDANLAASSVAAAAEPLLDQIVTPDGIIALLDRLETGRSGTGKFAGSLRPDAEGIGAVVDLVRASRWRGFRNVYFTLRPDPNVPGARLQFRLSRLKWRLSGIELPPATRQQLLDQFVRLQGERGRR